MIAPPVRLDYYETHMSMERSGGSPHEMRGSKARASEALWREALSTGGHPERYREVQEKLEKSEEELRKNIDAAIMAPAPAPEERERNLQEGRRISRRIQELRAEKEDLERLVRKAGGTPGGPAVP